LFAEEVARRDGEMRTLREEAAMHQAQAAAAEAELQSLIDAYRAAQIQIPPHSTTPGERAAPVVATKDDDVHVPSAATTTTPRGSAGPNDEVARLRRQVELLLEENQGLSDDLQNVQQQQQQQQQQTPSPSHGANGHGLGPGPSPREFDPIDPDEPDDLVGVPRRDLVAEVVQARGLVDALTDKLTEVKARSKQSALETLGAMEVRRVPCRAAVQCSAVQCSALADSLASLSVRISLTPPSP
jgi:hypothetical protein